MELTIGNLYLLSWNGTHLKEQILVKCRDIWMNRSAPNMGPGPVSKTGYICEILAGTVNRPLNTISPNKQSLVPDTQPYGTWQVSPVVNPKDIPMYLAFPYTKPALEKILKGE